VIGAVHLKHVTDLAWSPCGHFLVASSHDGYCTVVHFEPGELGAPVEEHSFGVDSIRQEIAQERQIKVRCMQRHSLEGFVCM
jgi:hypothetical protein